MKPIFPANKKTTTEAIVDRVMERLRRKCEIKFKDEQEAARFYRALDRAITERKGETE